MSFFCVLHRPGFLTYAGHKRRTSLTSGTWTRKEVSSRKQGPTCVNPALPITYQIQIECPAPLAVRHCHCFGIGFEWNRTAYYPLKDVATYLSGKNEWWFPYLFGDSLQDQDPAAFSREMARASRDVLMVRYKLLPFLYTLLHFAHVNGDTVARPLFHEWVSELEFNVPFQHKHGYIRDEVFHEYATISAYQRFF